METYARVVADSIAPSGARLTTMELCYHRFIHSEFMTHRMFSRNAASSRAIPTQKMLDQVEANPAMPIHWGKNQPGMQAREEIDLESIYEATDEWKFAANTACNQAQAFINLGVHKQIVNRLLEPFQYIKVIVTATEWDNFFTLRLHEDAQPEIRLLAQHMEAAMEWSNPVHLKFHEWHLPYVEFPGARGKELTLEKALKCSAARCARVSYLNHDNSTPDINKDIALAGKLLEAGHMSPFEHQGKPMGANTMPFYTRWEDGVTHLDRDGQLWSGNLRGFVQWRQML